MWTDLLLSYKIIPIPDEMHTKKRSSVKVDINKNSDKIILPFKQILIMSYVHGMADEMLCKAHTECCESVNTKRCIMVLENMCNELSLTLSL